LDSEAAHPFYIVPKLRMFVFLSPSPHGASLNKNNLPPFLSHKNNLLLRKLTQDNFLFIVYLMTLLIPESANDNSQWL
jgi:hypothetical protein